MQSPKARWPVRCAPMPETLFIRIGLGLFILCGVGGLVRRPGQVWRRLAMNAFFPTAIALTAMGLATRWWTSGQGPFLTLYEILLSNLFSLGLIFWLAGRLVPAAREAAPFVLVLLGLLAFWTWFLPTEITPLPPTFDNPWLWVHVLSGKLFLGTYLVATGLAVTLLVRQMISRAQGGENPEPGVLDQEIWRFAALAFVFESLMLVAGAAWAHDAWGRYWGWDPLETSAFITWFALAVLLHARLAIRISLPLQWMSVCLVFVLAFLTFFGVPFLSLAPHKGIV
jgi:ABC-type transport system involved in cytochrome c biogenesis permease subunit